MEVLWFVLVRLIDRIIEVLMSLLSLQEESIGANIDDDNKSELFLTLNVIDRTACGHFNHPCDFLFHLTQTKVFKGVYSVNFEAMLEHLVAKYFIASISVTMRKHKPNGLSGYLVFVVELDGLDPGGLDSLKSGIVAS